ncbi:MAG: alpha/beta hydrolase family protein [Bacteroidetes bacterium]|nr:alpha/beta hydrolase family protein [Bacteroidota bacterium]
METKKEEVSKSVPRKIIVNICTKQKIILVAVLFSFLTGRAASVDTVVVYSSCMKKEIKCVIIKPDTYKTGRVHFPTVYLLHGYGDRYDAWIKRVPEITHYSDKMQMIIVCPDGGYSSWYFDSPVDTTYKYETYVSREVVTYIDAHYQTRPDPENRAIAGLSMGGHGALYLALKHPDVFGAAGSMSGGVDLRPFPTQWDISKRIGDPETNKSNWENLSIVNMVGPYPAKPVAMIIDCGTEDFFYEVNKQLHQKLLKLKIPHDFIERPGIHNWVYWENAVEYQLLFFEKHFSHGNK